jgi:hypothetical protein
VTAAAGRHPSDADRAEAARPLLDELLRAAGAGDARALAACLDDEVVWLEAAGSARGRDAAVARLLAIARRSASWAPPQQHGAHAVLRWSASDGADGALVVEVRRGRVVLAAEP